jgi:hypothetical protein
MQRAFGDRTVLWRYVEKIKDRIETFSILRQLLLKVGSPAYYHYYARLMSSVSVLGQQLKPGTWLGGGVLLPGETKYTIFLRFASQWI